MVWGLAECKDDADCLKHCSERTGQSLEEDLV